MWHYVCMDVCVNHIVRVKWIQFVYPIVVLVPSLSLLPRILSHMMLCEWESIHFVAFLVQFKYWNTFDRWAAAIATMPAVTESTPTTRYTDYWVPLMIKYVLSSFVTHSPYLQSKLSHSIQSKASHSSCCWATTNTGRKDYFSFAKEMKSCDSITATRYTHNIPSLDAWEWVTRVSHQIWIFWKHKRP